MSFSPYIPDPVAVITSVAVANPAGGPSLRGMVTTFSEAGTEGPSHVSLLETHTPTYFSSSFALRKHGADSFKKEWVSDTFATTAEAETAAMRALSEIVELP